MSKRIGYNDMNTNAPNPFATQGSIVLSGAGRCKHCDREMDGAGWMDDIKKGYNKTKSAVKSETGQKIKKALMEDKDVMKEFNKAKKQLKDYTDGKRKTKPGKAAMDILEKAGVISKIEDEFKGGSKRGPSMWISHVKQFAQKNNLPYKEALSKAGPSYRAIKNKM